jgi:hypothetical protein
MDDLERQQVLRQELQTWLRLNDEVAALILDSHVMRNLWDGYYRRINTLQVVASKYGLLGARVPSGVVDAIMAAQKRGV